MVEFSSEITKFVDFLALTDVDLAHPKRIFTHTTPNLTVPRFGLVPGAPTTTGAQLEPPGYAPVSTSQSEVVDNLQTQAYYD